MPTGNPGRKECAELHVTVLYPKLRSIESFLCFRGRMSWRQREDRIIVSMNALPTEGKHQEEIMSVSHLIIMKSFFLKKNNSFIAIY